MNFNNRVLYKSNIFSAQAGSEKIAISVFDPNPEKPARKPKNRPQSYYPVILENKSVQAIPTASNYNAEEGVLPSRSHLCDNSEIQEIENFSSYLNQKTERPATQKTPPYHPQLLKKSSPKNISYLNLNKSLAKKSTPNIFGRTMTAFNLRDQFQNQQQFVYQLKKQCTSGSIKNLVRKFAQQQEEQYYNSLREQQQLMNSHS